MFKYLIALFCLILYSSPGAIAQLKAIEQIEIASKTEFPRAVSEFRDFLKLPNDGHFIDQIHTNMKWSMTAFEKRGRLRRAGCPRSGPGPTTTGRWRGRR